MYINTIPQDYKLRVSKALKNLPKSNIDNIYNMYSEKKTLKKQTYFPQFIRKLLFRKYIIQHT